MTETLLRCDSPLFSIKTLHCSLPVATTSILLTPPEDSEYKDVEAFSNYMGLLRFSNGLLAPQRFADTSNVLDYFMRESSDSMAGSTQLDILVPRTKPTKPRLKFIAYTCPGRISCGAVQKIQSRRACPALSMSANDLEPDYSTSHGRFQ